MPITPLHQLSPTRTSQGGVATAVPILPGAVRAACSVVGRNKRRGRGWFLARPDRRAVPAVPGAERSTVPERRGEENAIGWPFAPLVPAYPLPPEFALLSWCVISSFFTLPLGPLGESRPKGPERGAKPRGDHSRAALPGRYRVRPSRAREGEDVPLFNRDTTSAREGEVDVRRFVSAKLHILPRDQVRKLSFQHDAIAAEGRTPRRCVWQRPCGF